MLLLNYTYTSNKGANMSEKEIQRNITLTPLSKYGYQMMAKLRNKEPYASDYGAFCVMLNYLLYRFKKYNTGTNVD